MEKDESGKREKELVREQGEKQRKRWKNVLLHTEAQHGSIWEALKLEHVFLSNPFPQVFIMKRQGWHSCVFI